MTSRRCIVLEEGARELLELHNYTVRIVPVGYPHHSPKVHLVASRGPGETRYIRIKKVSRKLRTVQAVETRCRNEIVLYRKVLSGSTRDAGLHCEIWIYSLYDGYHCFEVLTGSVQEIPKLAPHTSVPLPDKGASS